MNYLKILSLFLLCLALLTMGCRSAAPLPPIQQAAPEAAADVSPPTLKSTVALPTVIIEPTLTLTPSPTPPPTATAEPTLTPSPTPLPPVTLAVPARWLAAATGAIERLNQSGPTWHWQLVEGESGDIILTADTIGTAIYQEPLTLAVPFTTDWEETTAVQAQEILASGHQLVSIQPWRDLQPNQKALRINGRHPTDPEYPLQTVWSLLAAPGYETAVVELAPFLQSAMSEPRIHLAAVGDLMLDRSLGYALRQDNLEYPFARVAHLLRSADITVGNLECALGDVGQPAPKSYTFRAPPQAAPALALAGFDVVSLANNHAMDYGPEALLQGLSLLHEQGVGTIGAGAAETEAYAPYITQTNGLTLAFLGYVHVPVEARSAFDTASWTAVGDMPGLAWADPARIQADVTAVRPQADLVIVVLHSGYEYVAPPSPPQVAASRAAIDAGADLVIGHHAHILQGIEFYNGGVIAYGLGNFAFEIDGDPSTAILNVWLDRGGVRQLEIVPAVIQFGGQPRLAEPWEAGPIRQTVYRLTQGVNASR